MEKRPGQWGGREEHEAWAGPSVGFPERPGMAGQAAWHWLVGIIPAGLGTSGLALVVWSLALQCRGNVAVHCES